MKSLGEPDPLTPTAIWQAWRLAETRAVRSNTVATLARYTGKSRAEIKRLLETAGAQTLAADDAVYTAAGLGPPPASLKAAADRPARPRAQPARPERAARDLDRIDRHILRILQQEGRISFTELGERVGLSTTPCTERVRRLERDGVIEGYYARLNPQALKAGLLVFVEISLAYKSGDIFEEFRRAALKLPNVLECHLMSGDFDYLLKARISEMASYRKLLGSSLLTLPHVRESKSYIVMEEVKETLALAIPD